MVLGSLLYAAGVDIGLQLAAGAVAIALGTEKFYDLTGSVTYLLLAYLTYPRAGANGRQKALMACMVAARIYLASFLFYRVVRFDGDKRFEKAKRDWRVFLLFWFMQGVWIIVTALPVVIANLTPRRVTMAAADYGALALALFGLAMEVTADTQKLSFRSEPANEDKFITSGLWSVSRHPNYFGEIIMWIGIYLLAFPVLHGWQHIAILSPIFTAWLLTRVSGIPILEKMASKRWGDNPAYVAYKQNTALLIPFVY